MIVHKYSIEEALPSGVVYTYLSRIRGTLTGHAKRLCQPGWFDKFNEKTTQAMMRRLTDYEKDCIGGMDIDIEEAYRDLVKRVAALLHLRKSIAARLDLTCETQLNEARALEAVALRRNR